MEVPRSRNTREENAAIKATPAGEDPGLWKDEPDKRAQKDTDARWTKKNEQTYYGYKNYVNVDQETPEGRYLLPTNVRGRDSEELWRLYIQLTEVEAAFKNLKDNLQVRPIYHQLEHRVEAHIFVAFMAYCLHVSLRAQLKPLAPGLTSRAVLDKFAAIQMLDMHFPTTDGRTLILSRYTELNPEQQILADQLKLTLPPQPPPRIKAGGASLPK